jgi:hypothetical protein
VPNMSDNVVSGAPGTRRNGVTAAELMARQEADPAWVAAREAEHRQAQLDDAASREQQAALLADLSRVGVEVADVWELVNTSEAYPTAIPVLMEHLHRDYDEASLEGIARALAVTGAAPFWDEVMELFRASDPDHVRVYQGLAVALSGMATRSLLPEVRKALRERSLGPGRIFFLHTLGRLRAPDRWDIIGELVDDPEIGPQARHLLHQHQLREAAKARRSAGS